jgi:hypothetical protein
MPPSHTLSRPGLGVLGAATVCAVLLSPAAVGAQSLSPQAKQVVAKARSASGGEEWNALRGWRADGWRRTGAQAEVRYEGWFDPLRYGFRVETREPGGLHIRAFNGQAVWEILPSGVATGGDDRDTLIAARNEAFLAVNGFFYPQRFTTRGTYVGVRQAQGRSFDVVSLQPGGGAFQELWFDRDTHLLGRVVDRTGPRSIVTEFSDYRKVGPVKVAFRTTVDDGDPAHFQERRIERVVFIPIDRTRFSLPPQAPKAAPAPPETAPELPTPRRRRRS